MSYHLSFADFQTYVGRLRPEQDALRAEGQGAAILYCYERFAKCFGIPPAGTALFPRSQTNCDPATYTSPDKWDGVFKHLVKQKASTSRRRLYPDWIDPTPPVDPSVDPACPREVINLDACDIADRLFDAIVNDFDDSVRDGPEIQRAMLLATEHLVEGSNAAWEKEVRDNLVDLLPAELDDGSERARKRLSRAVKRAKSFFAQAGERIQAREAGG